MPAAQPPSRSVALDALGRVVTACHAGMRALPELLDERERVAQAELRARIVPLLGAQAAAQRLAFEERRALRAALPFEAQADVGAEYLQGIGEALALLADDAGDPLVPTAEELARWTADPQVLLWLQRTSGAVPLDVLAWADGAQDELRPDPADAARTAAVRHALRAELGEQAVGYPALIEAYTNERTRPVAAEAAWARLAALARTLRALKGPSCRLTPFDPAPVRGAFGVLHQVFASLALVVAGEHPAGLLLAPDALAGACAC
ncbi:MAG TPA: hypothetical protein VFG42_26275 [Baekduia sp.]|uniref:hypothetical protein n=1 Tax=Baekduia sp. TaxID=2600305 RepID=UPI002D77E45C|nr:hypothetical protein [Baekduia sp.]HET6510328.1 hypothetical protein [Baekduia sp.]